MKNGVMGSSSSIVNGDSKNYKASARVYKGVLLQKYKNSTIWVQNWSLYCSSHMDLVHSVKQLYNYTASHSKTNALEFTIIKQHTQLTFNINHQQTNSKFTPTELFIAKSWHDYQFFQYEQQMHIQWDVIHAHVQCCPTPKNIYTNRTHQ